MNKLLIKIVFTDLDGTLLNSEHKVGNKDLEIFYKLAKKKIIRVIATGRNLYSLFKVLPPNFPIDFVIFSSGSGIIDWKTKKLIFSLNMENSEIKIVSEILFKNNINFMLHKKVPENHNFFYFHRENIIKDFLRRLNIYKKFAQKIDILEKDIDCASQFVAIFENIVHFDHIKEQLKNVNVIRTTSPLDHKSIWMEIFHENVSKQMGCSWLCRKLLINQNETISFGNDFNDLDMLRWSKHSFVMENSVNILKEEFDITKSHDENGISSILEKII